jgi:hypothetical protein
MRRFIILMFILSLSISSCNIQIFHRNSSEQTKTVNRAKKEQEANDRKLDKEYARIIKRSRERAIEIQTPEVQARMKQNKKDSAIRDKAKKKREKKSTKKGGKKYK